MENSQIIQLPTLRKIAKEKDVSIRDSVSHKIHLFALANVFKTLRNFQVGGGLSVLPKLEVEWDAYFILNQK